MASLQIQNQATDNKLQFPQNYEATQKDELLRTNKRCSLELSARSLQYIGGEWVFSGEEVAELVSGLRFEVKGRFRTETLCKNINYVVNFVIKMKAFATGWELPVTMKLQLPNGTTQQHEENLNEKRTDVWITIPVGSFFNYPGLVGEATASMIATDENPKNGLVIKEVTIDPVTLPVAAVKE